MKKKSFIANFQILGYNIKTKQKEKTMLRVFVDSGSSIKQNEKDKYNVEILPLKINLGDKDYLDGIDLSMKDFYDALINEGLFPKTSLPSLEDAEKRVNEYTNNGDDVLIITISSGISGTYNTLKMLFSENEKVKVIDSKSAVGGIRILLGEVNKYRNESLKFIEEKLLELIPRIKVCAIPETLEYLYKGGRLSRSAKIIGNIAQIKPLISLDSISGSVKVLGKAIGKKRAMQTLVGYLEKYNVDKNYPIVPSYTYNVKNLEELISITPDEFKEQMIEFDNLDPAIACHWGPNAFGYIFIGE